MMTSATLKMRKQPHINKNSDLRINYVTDAIKGVRTIKSCCFEEYFIKIIKEKRDAQV